MLIDKRGIARLIPHTGAMCLLDGVLSWDVTHIQCVTESHWAINNPLRRDGQLGVLCGVEYAAQAMAIHGALVAGETPGVGQPRIGYLASLRAITVHADRLDRLRGPLAVEAERLGSDADRAIYGFRLCHAQCMLLDGRAAVAMTTRAR